MDKIFIKTFKFQLLAIFSLICLPVLVYLIDIATQSAESDQIDRYLRSYLSNPKLISLGQPNFKVKQKDTVLETYQFNFSGKQKIYYFAFGVESSCAGTRIAVTNAKGEIVQKQWDYRYHEIAHTGLVWAFLPVPRYLLPSARFFVHVAYNPDCAKSFLPSVIPVETVNDWPALFLLDYIYEDSDGKLRTANTQGYQGASVPPKPPMDWIEPVRARLSLNGDVQGGSGS